jgi:hypothetical protein
MLSLETVLNLIAMLLIVITFKLFNINLLDYAPSKETVFEKVSKISHIKDLKKYRRARLAMRILDEERKKRPESSMALTFNCSHVIREFNAYSNDDKLKFERWLGYYEPVERYVYNIKSY